MIDVLSFERFQTKVKISALWMLVGFSMTLVFTIMDFDPGTNGLGHMLLITPAQQLPLILLGDAAIRLVPFVFAFLSLTLKDTWNRRMNLVLGAIFSIAASYGMVSLLLSTLSISDAYTVLIQVSTLAAPILIFRCAYKWPY